MYRFSYEYVQVRVSYTSSFLMCSRGRRRASVPRPGPSLSGILTANFQEFLTMFKPPKNARIVKKKKKILNENNRALRLSGLGPNNNNNKRSRFNRVLLHHRCSVPKYSCKQRWRAQAEMQTTTPVASGKRCPAGTCIYSNPLAVWF